MAQPQLRMVEFTITSADTAPKQGAIVAAHTKVHAVFVGVEAASNAEGGAAVEVGTLADPGYYGNVTVGHGTDTQPYTATLFLGADHFGDVGPDPQGLTARYVEGEGSSATHAGPFVVKFLVS